MRQRLHAALERDTSVAITDVVDKFGLCEALEHLNAWFRSPS